MAVFMEIVGVWFAISLVLAWLLGPRLKDGYHDARRAALYRRTERPPGLASFDQPTPVDGTRRARQALPRMTAVLDECHFAECSDPPTVEAIGTYDGVFDIETVALALCRRHADALGEELVVLDVA
jgi:hypothetical protein